MKSQSNPSPNIIAHARHSNEDKSINKRCAFNALVAKIFYCELFTPTTIIIIIIMC